MRVIADNVELNAPLQLSAMHAILKLTGVCLFKGKNWHLIEYIGYKLVRGLDHLSGDSTGMINPITSLEDYAVVEVRIPLVFSFVLSLNP
jgi:hypothetical protein